tara:strand:+ start:18 stop:530 length:513 start_codon:yes stop_codon:yes gene_type:complete
MSSLKKVASKVSKSVSKANRSISKSIDKKLDSPFDKYNLFESIGLSDHCWEEGGNKVRGPNITCWVIIFLIIASTLINFLAYNEYKKIGLTRNQILFRYLMLTIHSTLLATFVYSMCKRCRGLESIFILILVSIIQVVLTMAPFYGKITSEIRKLEGDSKIKSYIESIVQ